MDYYNPVYGNVLPDSLMFKLSGAVKLFLQPRFFIQKMFFFTVDIRSKLCYIITSMLGGIKLVKPQKNIIFLALCTIVLLIMEIVYTSVPPIVYGSVIALVLATVCLSSGLSSAILLCILSPVMSMLFSNIDRWVLVPAIIVANILYVFLIGFL